MTDISFIKSESYQQILAQVTSQLQRYITEIRAAHLWIPQGSGGYRNQAAILNTISQKESFEMEDLRVLKCISIDVLRYTPELVSFFAVACRMTLAEDQLMRLYAYALIRSNPLFLDLALIVAVLRSVLGFWDGKDVTLEYVGALVAMLKVASDNVWSLCDDNLLCEFFEQVERITKSENFSKTMEIDPTLQWVTRLPISVFKRVVENSFKELERSCEAHMCLLCKALPKGILTSDQFVDALRRALPMMKDWSTNSMQEARKLLATLASDLLPRTIEQILDLVADAFHDPDHISAIVYIFAEFVVVHYLCTTVPFHEKIFLGLVGLIRQKFQSGDVTRMFAALCGNPIRFLRAVHSVDDTSVFEVIRDYHMTHTSLYHVLVCSKDSALLSPTVAQEMITAFMDRAIISEELDQQDLILEHLCLCVSASFYAESTQFLFKFLASSANEYITERVLAFVAVVALSGRMSAWIHKILPTLPVALHECEYSDSLRIINSCAEAEHTPFEILNSRLSDKRVTCPCSESIVELAFMFQMVVATENETMYIAFNRTRLSTPSWFVFVASSLFTTMWRDPMVMSSIIDTYFEKSSRYIVWFAFILAKRLCSLWLDALADEKFDSLLELMLYPQLEGAFSPEEFQLAESLDDKYSKFFGEVHSIISASSNVCKNSC